MLLVFFSPLAIDIFLPAIPLIAEGLNTSLYSVQATIAMFLLAGGFGQLFTGPMADRFGRRPMALGGVALYLFGAVVAATATTIEALWLSRFLQGFGSCAISVAVSSGVRDTYGPERAGPIFSYLNGAICVIPALAPLLGGLLTEMYNWRASFYFMAAFAFFGWLVIYFKLPETRPENTDSSGTLISWARFKPVLHNSTFIFHSVLMMLAMAIIIGYVTGASVQLMVNMHLSPYEFSLWFGANAVINIGAAVGAPTLVQKIGKKQALIISVIAALVSATGLMLLPMVHPIHFMGPVFIACLSFSIILSISGGAALAPFGERAGTASALLGLIQMGGSSLLVGAVYALPVLAVYSLAILMILPAVWYVGFRLSGQHYRNVMQQIS